MINAFMEGVHSAKKGKKILHNPYSMWDNKYERDLWEQGFMHQLETDERVAFQNEATSYTSSGQVSDAS